MTIRLAHFSDIHFFHFEKGLFQFFSKRFLGNFNYFLNRKRHFDQSLAYSVVDFLLEKKISHLVITGDYTCTSSKSEFKMMQDYIKFLKNKGFTVYTFPGNHDAYTKKADKNKTFYKYLDGLIDFKGDTDFNLIEHRVAAYRLNEHFWLVCADLALSTSLTQSTGLFDIQTEINLKKILEKIPKSDSIIFANHFPYEKYRFPRAHLQRGEALEAVINNHPNIKLFIHGHRHKQRIEKSASGHLLLDSGSLSTASTSSLNLIELDLNSYNALKYQYKNSTWHQKLND